jgi:hypothetical protein
VWRIAGGGPKATFYPAPRLKGDIYLPMKPRKRTSFKTDQRRKHHHWQVTVFYKDGERFARTYTNHEKAAAFAERQKKSPVVKTARVTKVS